MELVLDGTRPRGRPKLRWLDRINADLKEISAQIVDAQDRVRWKNKIRIVDPKSM